MQTLTSAAPLLNKTLRFGDASFELHENRQEEIQNATASCCVNGCSGNAVSAFSAHCVRHEDTSSASSTRCLCFTRQLEAKGAVGCGASSELRSPFHPSSYGHDLIFTRSNVNTVTVAAVTFTYCRNQDTNKECWWSKNPAPLQFWLKCELLHYILNMRHIYIAHIY